MDTEKKQTEVIIGGRSYKLGGGDSEHIKEVASYVDKKLRELNRLSSSDISSSPSFPIILALNISDDLFKAKEELEKVNKTDAENVQKSVGDENDEKKIKDLLSDIEAKDKEIAELRYKISSAEDEKNKLSEILDAQKAQFQKQTEEYNSSVSSLNDKLANAEKRIQEKSQYIATVLEKVDRKNKEINNLSNKLSEKNNLLNELNEKSAEKNIKLNTVNKERDELAVKLKNANAELKNKDSEIKKIKKSCEDEIRQAKAGSTGAIEMLSKQLKKTASELDIMTADYNTLKEEFRSFQSTETDTQLQQEFSKIRTENIDLRRQVNKLKEELSSIEGSLN